MNGVIPLRTLLTRSLALAALVCVAWPARAADEAASRAALERLVGEWTGEVQIKAMDGFVLKTVSASRRAGWEGDTLVVASTLADGAAEYAFAARQTIRLGRLESAVTRPGQPVDRLLGELVGGALVWTNAEGNRRDAREQVAERSGALVLETSSVEPIRAFGLSGLVRLEGRFRRPVPAPESSAPAGRPAAGSDAALAAEVATLRQALEAEQAASAELRGRAEQAERRATEAEARAQTLETSTAEAGASTQRTLEMRTAALEAEHAAATRERDELRSRLASLEQAAVQAQRDIENLLAANQRLTGERDALAAQARETEARLATASAPASVAPGPAAVVSVAAGAAAVDGAPTQGGPSFSAAMREQLIAEVQQMERRVLELESERNTAREQAALTQRQLDETRRLRDDTLLRFQTVVSELNAMREEKERLARANVSLQAEVHQAQQVSRPAAPAVAGATPPAAVSATAPATTFDGKTADMVIAGLQIIGVTRGDGGEDKAILDGRVFRNGDLVEAQLGIVFVGIDGNSLVFHDRRGREYRRRF